MLLEVQTLLFITFISGWMSTYFYRKQLLLSLLSLEMVVLSMFMMMLAQMASLGKPISISFYLLVLGACEASLGLSLLVSMVRLSGSDMLSNMSSIKC